jgi:hypothetical protein
VGQSLVLNQTPTKVVVVEPNFSLAISGEKISYMTLPPQIPYMTPKTFLLL